ncbi:MAG: cysteine desulfurase family protein, partial [Candidatus Enteromonas sp.]
NNETGTIEPISEIARIVHRFPKAFFHSDLTQAIGKVAMPFPDIDLFSFSAHKFGGMKGNGALLYKKTMRFLPLLSGGEQEKGLRAGTVDVAGAKAMAVALVAAEKSKASNLERMKALRESFVKKLLAIDEIVLNSPEESSPYVIDFSLRSHKASVVVEALSSRGYDVSSVSACSSKGEPSSYVLLAMGKDPRLAANPIRVSFLPSTKEEELDGFIDGLKHILQEVRPL